MDCAGTLAHLRIIYPHAHSTRHFTTMTNSELNKKSNNQKRTTIRSSTQADNTAILHMCAYLKITHLRTVYRYIPHMHTVHTAQSTCTALRTPSESTVHDTKKGQYAQSLSRTRDTPVESKSPTPVEHAKMTALSMYTCTCR